MPSPTKPRVSVRTLDCTVLLAAFVGMLVQLMKLVLLVLGSLIGNLRGRLAPAVVDQLHEAKLMVVATAGVLLASTVLAAFSAGIDWPVERTGRELSMRLAVALSGVGAAGLLMTFYAGTELQPAAWFGVVEVGPVALAAAAAVLALGLSRRRPRPSPG